MHHTSRTLITFLITACMLAATAHAQAAEAPLKIGVFTYNVSKNAVHQETFREVNPAKKEVVDDASLFFVTVTLLQRQLKKQGRDSEVSYPEAKVADFRFIKNPTGATETIKPKQFYATLPPNKHAATATAEPLTSPWLRAVLYRDAKKRLVGGDIWIVQSRSIRLSELLFMAEGDWEAARTRPMETAEDFLFQYPGSNAEEVKKRTTVDYHFAGINDISGDCLFEAFPFYLKLYDFYMNALLAPVGKVPMEADAGYNFLPPISEMKRIADSTEGYNCFIR